jgi:chaperone BCS1
LQWLTTQAQRSRSSVSQHITVDTVTQRLANGKSATRFEFTPYPGRHVMWYEGRVLVVDRVREQATVDLHTGQPWECVKLTAIGNGRELFQSFLAEAQAHAAAKQEATTIVYTNWGTEWRPFGTPRRRRPLHSVVLDDGIAEHVLTDVREFVASTQWYIDRGIPYRRGYLMHGPPGCGKSSFVAALAGELGYDICILNLSDAGLTDDRLAHALSTTPPSSLVLLEDVDAAFVYRDPKDRRSSHVTFSGLLNALDGVAAGEERILFMTTNHIERLDPALIRPGRVDVIHQVGNASSSQCRRMFLKFFPDEAQLAESFVQTAGHTELSMALLQSYFMLYRHSAQEACMHAIELCEGVNATKEGTPVQQHMAEMAVQQQQEGHEISGAPRASPSGAQEGVSTSSTTEHHGNQAKQQPSEAHAKGEPLRD